jgi:hypothetical protein
MSNRRRRRAVRERPSGPHTVSLPISDFEKFLTDEDREQMRRVMELEAAGDLAAALQLLRRQPRVVGAGHERHLAEMVRLGDSAPPWAWSRWIVGAAYRWALTSADPRTDRAVLEVFAATYLDDETYSYDLGTMIAATDALVADLVAFDLGVLQDYLDVQAGPALLDRADCVQEWGSRLPSVFRLAEARGDRLVVHDQVSAQQREVVHTGEALGTSIGEWVLGRIVPAGGDETVFASRPVTIGQYAGQLLRQSMGEDGDWRARLGCLHEAIRVGELAARPGWQADSTALTHGGSLRDDAAWRGAGDEPPAALVRALMAEGMSRQTADHLCVLELALETARRDLPGAVEMVAQHAAIALMWPEVRQQAARRYAGPNQRTAWRRLGACLPPHARQPFDALADDVSHERRTS